MVSIMFCNVFTSNLKKVTYIRIFPHVLTHNKEMRVIMRDKGCGFYDS